MSPHDRQYQHQGRSPENSEKSVSGKMFSLQTADFTFFLWLTSSFSRVFVTSRQLLSVSVDLHYKGGSVKCLRYNYYGWAFNLFVGVVSLLSDTLCLLDADILSSTRDVLTNVNINI